MSCSNEKTNDTFKKKAKVVRDVLKSLGVTNRPHHYYSYQSPTKETYKVLFPDTGAIIGMEEISEYHYRYYVVQDENIDTRLSIATEIKGYFECYMECLKEENRGKELIKNIDFYTDYRKRLYCKFTFNLEHLECEKCGEVLKNDDYYFYSHVFCESCYDKVRTKFDKV